MFKDGLQLNVCYLRTIFQAELITAGTVTGRVAVPGLPIDHDVESAFFLVSLDCYARGVFSGENLLVVEGTG